MPNPNDEPDGAPEQQGEGQGDVSSDIVPSVLWDNGAIGEQVRSALQKPLHLLPDDAIADTRARAELDLEGIYPCVFLALAELEANPDALSAKDQSLLILGIGLYTASLLAAGSLPLSDFGTGGQEKVKVGPIEVTSGGQSAYNKWTPIVEPYRLEALRKMRLISCVQAARKNRANRPAIVTANPLRRPCMTPCERRRVSFR